jgi:putative sporulation protein YyaC
VGKALGRRGRLLLETRERLPLTPCRPEVRVDIADQEAAKKIGLAVSRFCAEAGRPASSETVVLCVGTDRSTGDALGPLIGQHLKGAVPGGVHVYGTLDLPVHAANWRETLSRIDRYHAGALVIAIDACLGNLDSVGTVAVGRGTLKPGAGVQKDLPSAGDVYVTGVVNVGGFMEYFVLQNTRLNLVWKMHSVILAGLSEALSRR